MIQSSAKLDSRVVLAYLAKAPVSPIFWIVLLWFALVVPAIGLRGAHFEEGTTLGIARGTIEDGHWCTPHLYGNRFVERPVLVSWMLGGVGWLLGCMPVAVGRLPAAFSVLAGAMLIYWLVKQHASDRAALFAAICFLINPMILQKVVTAEVDSVVSLLLFAAFILWWLGHARGGPTVGRWLAIAGVLTVAGFVKGPQPLGFFFLGIGAYLLLKRQWKEILALALCGLVPATMIGAWYWSIYQPGDLELWQSQSRLVAAPSAAQYFGNAVMFVVHILLEWLPAILLALPAAVALIRRRFTGDRELLLVLLLYASVCSAVLVFWPGVHTRYAMPGCLALAAAAGLAFDGFAATCPRLVFAAKFTAACLTLWAMVFGWLVLPLAPRLFDETRRQGEMIAAILQERPGTLYVMPEVLNKNVLLYVPPTIRIAPFEKIAELEPPYWAIVTPEQEEQLLPPTSDRRVAHRLSLRWPDDVRLIDAEKSSMK